ncbi:DUF397 domain-containing protein [Nocardiopsis sp. HUAS JQ3]|uniref:DUF397 domain-containing protein n=1 Tax=Nocardiopsis sp. HUAS JQ3 TaxID=3061629 RepID=UPI0023A9BCDD|nr:DUF397 domain-containing protein [Nocardiopsis sp. HUAS JQ3]WDZ88963.1 DUF397 domain-containing protein [Nocardiopsis sp. HUAS JQ3]
MTEERAWHTASYSSGSGNCVEVSEGSETLVRDTHNRELGYLSAQASEWTALLAAVRGW